MNDTSGDFVHLRVHTGYNLGNSTIRPADLVQRIKDLGMPAVAVTEDGVMFSALRFYRLALAAGIKPLLGCDCYLAPRAIANQTPADHEGLSRLVLLAETGQGYRNLCRLATIAAGKGFFHYPRVDKDLLQSFGRGLIGLSAGRNGEIARLLSQGRQAEADEAARQYCRLLGEDNFFLEIQKTDLPGQEQLNTALREMSQRLSLPLVGSNNCRYLAAEDSFAHQVLSCHQAGTSLADPEAPGQEPGPAPGQSPGQLYVKSAQKMRHLLADFPGAADNTLAIADRCQVEIDLHTRRWPAWPVPPGQTTADLLTEKARSGLAKKWPRLHERHPDSDKAVYQQRLDQELDVIIARSVTAYFLIVADLVDTARQRHIRTGPGRGAAGSSLVCFCLGITELDPVAHGLLFERFFNDQTTVPDIDLDVCDKGRQQLRDYLREKYAGPDSGKPAAADIITFPTFKSRGLIRDVGRAMGIPMTYVGHLARLVPEDARDLADAAEKEPSLQENAATLPELTTLLNTARRLEGLPFHIGRHAAGLVMGDAPLTRYLPLYRREDPLLTQFDAEDLDALGLLRLDLLGLRDLTVMTDTLALMEKQGLAAPDLAWLDPADTKTCQLLARGDTTGVFQLQSTGMKELLPKAQPRSLTELAVLIALYRPGPLENGMMDDYLARKNSRGPATCPVAALEPVLRETRGLIIYQEQIMQIARTIAGYTPAESDQFRRALGKKRPEELAGHCRRFISAAVANGQTETTARQLFEELDRYGGYGFNKAHSTAYAWLAWQNAWLKAHFPMEFMAAWIRTHNHRLNAVAELIAEYRSGDLFPRAG